MSVVSIYTQILFIGLGPGIPELYEMPKEKILNFDLAMTFHFSASLTHIQFSFTKDHINILFAFGSVKAFLS